MVICWRVPSILESVGPGGDSAVEEVLSQYGKVLYDEALGPLLAWQEGEEGAGVKCISASLTSPPSMLREGEMGLGEGCDRRALVSQGLLPLTPGEAEAGKRRGW